MSELRRLRPSALGLSNNGTISEEDDMFGQPLDIEEQEELIQQFEQGNSNRNCLYVNVLTGFYIICAFPFFNQMRSSTSKERWFSGLCCISVVLSISSLRYGIVTNFRTFNSLQLRMNNTITQRINIMVLILVEWLLLMTEFSHISRVVSQMPFFLFIVSFLTKRWVKSMEAEISSLRSMKYKYKGV